jgi:hypothetical protein
MSSTGKPSAPGGFTLGSKGSRAQGLGRGVVSGLHFSLITPWWRFTCETAPQGAASVLAHGAI